MLYDATSGERLHLLEGHQNTAACVAFSPDGRWLATGSHDRTIRVWDVATGKTRHVIAAHRDKIRSLVFSPDGRTIASGDQEGMIAFSHVETGRFLFDVETGLGTVRFLSFSPDGEALVATWPGEGVVLLHAPGGTPGSSVRIASDNNLIKNPGAEFGLTHWIIAERGIAAQPMELADAG